MTGTIIISVSKPIESTENIHPLSKATEIRTDVTPDLLKKILKLTAKTKQIDPTQELKLHGSIDISNNMVTSDKIKQLKSSCPSMKALVLENVNLYTKQKKRRARLIDFPSNIERISLRSSTFEPKTFFSNFASTRTSGGCIEKLRVLDVGRAVFIENGDFSADSWPVIESLKELYLEGAPHIDNGDFLERLLLNFPNLEILDLEGTTLSDDALVTIARCSPNLRELYLGCTQIQDGSILQLIQNGLSFPNLEVICLCETNVTDHGLDALVRCCQSLRTITVRRSKVSEKAAQAAKKVLPGLQVNRVEHTHIYAVFRDQGCGHFSSKHDIECK